MFKHLTHQQILGLYSSYIYIHLPSTACVDEIDISYKYMFKLLWHFNNPLYLRACTGKACTWWEGLGFEVIVGKGTESCALRSCSRSFLAVRFFICSSNRLFSTWSWCNDLSIPKTKTKMHTIYSTATFNEQVTPSLSFKFCITLRLAYMWKYKIITDVWILVERFKINFE